MHTAADGQKQPLSKSAARRRRRHLADYHAYMGQMQQPLTICQAKGPAPSRRVDAKRKPLPAEAFCPALVIEQLNAGGAFAHNALLTTKRSVRKFAFDQQGSRALQLAILTGSKADVLALVDELHGCVRGATSSPHANFVIQKVIEVLPAASFQFIATELRGYGAYTACHRYGCRILTRLLEHASDNEHVLQLMEEVLASVGDLIRHKFGHYVIEAILEHGVEMQKKRIYSALEQEAAENVRNSHALFVLDRALNKTTAMPKEMRSCLCTVLCTLPETTKALNDPVTSEHLRNILLSVEDVPGLRCMILEAGC